MSPLLTEEYVQDCVDGDVPSGHIDFVIDGPPGPEAGRFVEVECETGSIRVGKWIERKDGCWALRVDVNDIADVLWIIEQRDFEARNA